MGKISILLVEDYADTRALIQMLLESAGYDVVSKEDGAEALEYLCESRPDLILTDLMMPKVSGIELIEQVKANARLANIPIVAMTAYSSGPISAAKNAGANAILKKPISFEVMTSTVNELLPPVAR